MRFLLVLALTISILLAFDVACGGKAEEAPAMPAPASESEGEAEEWEEGEGAPPAEDEADEGDGDEEDGGEAEADEDGDGVPDIDDNCPDDANPGQDDYDGDLEGDECDVNDDNDGYADLYETDHGSDPLNEASVPELADHGDTCTDGVDNDLDGDTDDADDGCPLAGFRVVSANLGVTPRDYVGPCPVTLTFSGTITLAAGSGTVSYQFVRNDSGVTPIETLTFDSPGTQDVSVTAGYGPPAGDWSYSGWMVIRILEPEERESNRANFTITCEG